MDFKPDYAMKKLLNICKSNDFCGTQLPHVVAKQHYQLRALPVISLLNSNKNFLKKIKPIGSHIIVIKIYGLIYFY